MMQLFYKLILLYSILAAVTSCGEKSDSSKIVFMNNVRVFEEFAMKKDYDKKMESELSPEANHLDSLETNINAIGNTADTLELFRLRKTYYVSQQQYEQKYQTLSTQYTKEVNDRLNEYVKSYAEKNGVEIVLGSGGQGNVMYVKDALDVTDDLIKYINTAYEK